MTAHTIRCSHPSRASFGCWVGIKPTNTYTCQSICPHERAGVTRFNTLHVAELQSSVFTALRTVFYRERNRQQPTFFFVIRNPLNVIRPRHPLRWHPTRLISLNPREFRRKRDLVPFPQPPGGELPAPPYYTRGTHPPLGALPFSL